MLKGNSMDFDKLMAQAAQVALEQDASLIERARQKKKEQDERRRREEIRQREEQKLQAKQRQQLEAKQKLLNEQKKQRETEPKRPKKDTSTTQLYTKPNPIKKQTSHIKRPNTNFISPPEKKKPVHMSFTDLMKKAKEQASHPKPEKPRTAQPKKKATTETSSLYNPIKHPGATKPKPTLPLTQSARDKARQLISEPPKKVIGQKRDRRSISEIQRDIRHTKGIYSDDEEDERKRRLVKRIPIKVSSRPEPSRVISKPKEPPKRPPAEKRPPSTPLPRMPFSGKPLHDKTPKRRYRREDDEMDEDLASFIVDDEEEEYGKSHKNSYSDEIRKIFKYDKNKYANEPVYSDDDMEANAIDVLREEKRSERIARREDYLEEQKEIERLKRRKKGGV